jgi:serine/threonine-protein kinase haspin
MKVGEGSYGEVFKLEKRDIASLRAATPPQQDQDDQGGCIFKLIPLRAKGNRSNNHTSLDDLLREVQMLKLLDPIPGFVRFRDCTVLQGPYPPSFTEAYHDYKAVQGSMSTSPSRYPDKQLWVIIEMDDGGTDLETLIRPSAYQVFDIFWSTCCALSYAEAHAEFEVCAPQMCALSSFADICYHIASRSPHRQHLHQIL